MADDSGNSATGASSSPATSDFMKKVKSKAGAFSDAMDAYSKAEGAATKMAKSKGMSSFNTVS